MRDFALFVSGIVIGVLIVFMFGFDYTEHSHYTLGSKSHACFANHTCRENLVCMHGEGLEPGVCASRAIIEPPQARR